VGGDHQFGKNRSGNVKHLSESNDFSDLKIEVVDLKLLHTKISSTEIRNALTDGNLAMANEMLGYQYFLTGKVIKSNQIGRTIGFPTANIEVPDYKLIPKGGVYRVKIKIDDDERNYVGMLNIGKRTAQNQTDETIHIEVNIFDFDRQIYGHTVSLWLTDRIRDHKNFANVDELARQLHKDKIVCKNM
jgi:riboflavin kinase/FMN adenylyltransferase